MATIQAVRNNCRKVCHTIFLLVRSVVMGNPQILDGGHKSYHGGLVLFGKDSE